MEVSDKGLGIIKLFESFRSKAYICPAGVVTIGYGTTVAEGRRLTLDMTATEEEALKWLRTDVAAFEKAIHQHVKVELNQEMFDALVCFVYNVGATNFSTSTLLKKLNVKNYLGAADEFPKWNKAKGKVLPGLIKRRVAERCLFLEGVSLVTAKSLEPAVQSKSVSKTDSASKLFNSSKKPFTDSIAKR